MPVATTSDSHVPPWVVRSEIGGNPPDGQQRATFRWSTLRLDHRLLSLEPSGLIDQKSRTTGGGSLGVRIEFGE
jgi:hypothetical protein